MGDIKRSGSSGWKNGSHKKIKSKPQLTKNLWIVRCRGVMGFLCINSSLKTDCFHEIKKRQSKNPVTKTRTEKSKNVQVPTAMPFDVPRHFQCLMTRLWIRLRGWGRLESIYLWGRNFRATRGLLRVGLLVKRWWYIYIYMMICNSWAVGPQLLGSEFIHLEAIVFSCTVATVIRCLGLAFGGFLIDQI